MFNTGSHLHDDWLLNPFIFTDDFANNGPGMSMDDISNFLHEKENLDIGCRFDNPQDNAFLDLGYQYPANAESSSSSPPSTSSSSSLPKIHHQRNKRNQQQPSSVNNRRKREARLCQWPGGCFKYQQGRTQFCITHGGGRRCLAPGCSKSVQGKSQHCISHGGGRRCQYADCHRSARGSTKFCVTHGGGHRCQIPGCNRSAQSPGPNCIAHGGGRRCIYPLCTTGARSPSPFCVTHQKYSALGDGLLNISQFASSDDGGVDCDDDNVTAALLNSLNNLMGSSFSSLPPGAFDLSTVIQDYSASDYFNNCPL
jgi:hypothetical protein